MTDRRSGITISQLFPMVQIDIDQVNYYFDAVGAGPPLVLLHGFTGSTLNWQPHVRFFAAYFQVITIDLLGHGRTDAPPDAGRYRIEACAEDVIAILDAVASEPAHVLGYSMGGRLALYLAITQPASFRSLILESASPGLKTPAERRQRRQQDEAIAHRIERDGIAAFVHGWERMPLFASHQHLPEEVRETLHRQRLHNKARGLANSLRGMGTGAQPSLWPRLGELILPALLIVGELDRKFVVINEEMRRRLPNAELHRVRDAGHTVHLEQPERFNQVVLRWLKEH